MKKNIALRKVLEKDFEKISKKLKRVEGRGKKEQILNFV